MTMLSDFLSEIDAFIERRGIKETTFGRLAVNDGKFVGRLRAGKGVTLDLVERVRAYMRDHSPDTEVSVPRQSGITRAALSDKVRASPAVPEPCPVGETSL